MIVSLQPVAANPRPSEEYYARAFEFLPARPPSRFDLIPVQRGERRLTAQLAANDAVAVRRIDAGGAHVLRAAHQSCKRVAGAFGVLAGQAGCKQPRDDGGGKRGATHQRITAAQARGG